MTTLCGGGSSGPKAGTQAVVAVASGYIALMLDEAGIGWVKQLIPLMTLPEIALSTFCASDPPAIQTFTQAEVNALTQLDLGNSAFASGLPKLAPLISNLYWNEFCQCTSGTYTAPSWPSQPSGSISVVQPPNLTPTGVCNIVGSQTASTVTPPGNNFGGSGLFSNFPALSFLRFHVAANSVGGGPHNTGSWNIYWNNNSGPFLLQQMGSIPSDGIVRTFDVFPRKDAVAFGQMGINVPAATTDTFVLWCEFFCTQSGTQLGCCPPDVTTTATLQAILSLVTSMQRNYAPFGYVLGSSSSGLTGTGSVSVSRCIGVKVAITAYPPANQVLPGNPTYVKDLGWISVSETDGMIQELRIARTAFTWFPQLAPLANSINYFLQPGVTATITPIFPEA